MKFLKGIFYTLAALVIALCAFILVCAVNPKLTEAMAATVQGAKIAGLLDRLLGRAGDSDDIEISDDGQAVIIEVPTNEVPTELAGLTGYKPIEMEEEKITDEVAESIKKSLSTGETGEGLDFDALIYPYYAMLGSDEQAVYRQIYANAQAVNSSFAPIKAITADQLSKIFECVVNDHPELFFLNTSYSVKYTKSGSVVEIQLAYYTLANALDSSKENFENAANTVVAGAAGISGVYEKQKYVHDYLIDHVTYDSGASLGQSAYSALVNGRSVCAGYARANQYILQKLGIPCYYCTGYAGEDHAWNIVKLTDGYYNEDVTWDDTNPSTYDYFDKNDNDFSTTHTRTGLSVYLPPCNGTQYRGLEKGSTSEVTGGDPTSLDSDETMKPLEYDDLYPEKQDNKTDNNGNTAENTTQDTQDTLLQALLNLGYKETDADWTMEEYYEDCKAKLIAAGSGDRHFTAIVPAALFTQIEKEYGTGAYKKGYVEEALKALGMNRFSIQIQAERMGGGFYKLYHNVVSWKDESDESTNKTDNTDNTNSDSNTNNESNNNSNSNTNNNNNSNTNNNSNNSSNNNSNSNSNSGSNESTPEKEKEALEKAKAYLKDGIYSADALKKVLMETDSFTNSVAEYAIKNCGADWNDQAIKKAKEYIASAPYSAAALKSLLADKDLFTVEQADNAVNNAGINYEQQAVKKAQQYLAGKDVYSAAGMKKVLVETDKFTEAEAAFAVENCGADWKAQAVKKAKEYKGESESITHDELVKKLTDDGFTVEEAEYGTIQNGI